MDYLRFRNRITGWIVLAVAVALLGSCGGDSPKALVASAKDYVEKGDYNAALIQLRNALQKQADNAEARYLLGTVLVDRGDSAGAVKELRKALELGYPREQTLPVLARALVEDGDAKELVDEFGGVSLEDRDAQAAFKTTVGNALLALGRRGEAETAFMVALAAKPDYADALLGIAVLHAGSGDMGAAKQVVDRVLAQPNPPRRAALLKAQFLIAEDHRQEARAYLEQVVGAMPDYAEARYVLTSLLLAAGDLDQASAQIAAIRQASKQDRRAYYFEALIALRRGDLPAAREAVQQVLKGGVEHVPSLLLAGEIEFRAKQYNQAQDYLRRALKQSPDLPMARRLLATTYLRSGSPARAIDLIERSLKADDKDPQLMALAGEAYIALGDLHKADYYLAKTTAIDPKNVAVRTRLGQVKFAEGDTEAAIRDLEAAAALDQTTASPDLVLIVSLLRQKKYDDALAAVGRLEKKQPNSALVYNLKGLVYSTKRDLPTARANFEKAIQLQPNFLPAISNLSQLDRLDGKPDVGRKRFEAVLETEPKNEQALLGLANFIQSGGGDPKEIEALLKRAVEANPQSVAARVALANFYVRRGDTRQALLVAQDAASAIPNDPRTVDLLGQAQLAAGNSTQALETFNKLATMRPDTVEPLLRLARALAAAKDYDKAIEELREVLKINPSLYEANREIAAIYAMSDRPELAVKEAKAVQRRQADDPRGYLLEGDLWAAQKKWPEAEAAFKAALRRAPGDATLAVRLHAATTSAGKATEADATADKWLREHPKDIVMRTYLADRALRRRDFKSAAAHYQAVLAQQPNNPVFLNNLAWAMNELGDPQAMSYAEKALALAPESPAVLDTVGTLLVKRDDVSQGLEKLQKAAQLAPNQSDIRLHLAKALIKAGNKDAARKELEALSQASSQPAASAAADGKGSAVEPKGAQPGTAAKPTLVCGPDCAAETAALLKTL
ncbi:MAG TPA: XrtA/PEP-CTERM system TPR-repeat protein PrsT [Casimicrobiaceae bacterium]|nr:XrtA/PEP-CTERM system TPR-repeat protein PrsT [Casimicrobiaceae bacterium]